MDVLFGFKHSLANPDPVVIQDVNQYIEWQLGIEEKKFTRDAFDDVVLRRYLLNLQFQGADQETSQRIVSSLENFYT